MSCISILKRVGVALLVVCYKAAFAADVMPPPIGLSEEASVYQSPPNATRPFFSQLLLGTLAITLEETTLKAVQEHFRLGEIAHQGDAGGSLYWLCYTATTKNGPQRIWIESGELFGGKEAYLFSAEILQDVKSSSAKSCPTISLRDVPLTMDNNIWLNLSIEEIERRVGAKAKKEGRYFVFTYAGKLVLPREDKNTQRTIAQEYDLLNFLTVEIQGGRAVRLWASRTTTN
jgi:hypothetical protein